MGRAVAVSFEGKAVKVVYATVHGKETSVTDALTLEESQFDGFLGREKTREFVVVKSFREHYQETFQVPSTKKKYLARIIETEIGKRCGFKEHSFIYSVSGEKPVENRKVVEVSAFAVKNEELYGLIERFAAKGKTVKAVYPDAYSLNSMVEVTKRPVLCVTESAEGKDFFLVKDGQVAFLREVRRLEEGAGDFEMQNIEMTLNYCRQTLRTNPSSVLLTGRLSDDFRAGSGSSVPMACLVPPLGLRADKVTFLDYSIAVSALYGKSDIDITPGEYRTSKLLSRTLRYSTAAFLALTALGGAYTWTLLNSALEIRSEHARLTEMLPDLEAVISSYEKEREKAREYRPLLTMLAAVRGYPPVRGLLEDLTRVKTEEVRIESISVSTGDGALSLSISGTAERESLAGAEGDYERFIGSLGSRPGMKITNEAFGLKERRFLVEAEYR